MDTANDDNVPSTVLEASRRVCRKLAEEVIRRGLVSPEGKTDEQLKTEVISCLKREFDNELIGFVHDHTPTLLEHARTHRIEGSHYLACLLYATWAEHWINGLISTVGERRKTSARGNRANHPGHAPPK